MRVAVEFRHPSWHCEEVFALLAEYRAAYCVLSGANLPCVLRATTDVVYLRLHGPDDQHLYAGSYSGADLAWWAHRIREWAAAGHEVFAYFNNDGEANAVRNARLCGCSSRRTRAVLPGEHEAFVVLADLVGAPWPCRC